MIHPAGRAGRFPTPRLACVLLEHSFPALPDVGVDSLSSIKRPVCTLSSPGLCGCCHLFSVAWAVFLRP